MNFFKGISESINNAAGDVQKSLQNIFSGGRGAAKTESGGGGHAFKPDFFMLPSTAAKQGTGATFYNKDAFFRYAALNPSDHRINYGYEFVIADGGNIVASLWLPINPQSISINVPSAVTVESTMKGIVETHNAAPLRQINITGTSGIFPAYGPKEFADKSELQKTIEYAFQNTITSINRVISNAERVSRAFSGGTDKVEGPLNFTSESDRISGYMFIHELSRFLDYYLAAKKLPENKSWRLYFQMYKDQAYYACTLNGYSIQKVAGTLEYTYNINLTAWRRSPEPIGGRPKPTKVLGADKDSLSLLNRIVNGIRESRRLLASVHGVMRGIRNDIDESLIQPVGELLLLMTDSVNLASTMYDFAFKGDLVRSLEPSWRKHITENGEALNAAIGGLAGRFNISLGTGFQAKPVSAAVDTAVEGEAKGVADLNPDEEEVSANPIKNIFNNPADYPEVFEAVSIDDLSLSTEVQSKIEEELERIRSFTADDIRKRRDMISDFSVSISESFGGASATYNRVNDLEVPKKTYNKLTVENITILKALNDIVMQLDSLIQILESNTDQLEEDYYSFYADYAIANNIPFESQNASKFFIPFPYGASLEMLALQYLGDADRWIEIAALNALKAPYIDEEGYDIPVTASAGGNTLTVGEAPNLYIGQVVRVESDVEPSTIRKIRSIDIVSSAETIVTFEDSSESNLALYKPKDNARILAFLPNTVNSNMLIAIPSQAPVTVQSLIKTTPGIEDLNGIAQIAKQDLLLDLDGDLVFTGGGDIKTATGMTNIVQAALLKLRTKAGSLVQHPDYGNTVEPGRPTSEIDAEQVLESLKVAFNEDSRFSGILAAEINKDGPTMTIKLLVGIADTDVTLPLSAQIPL